MKLKLFRFRPKNQFPSKHYENLMSGETIYIDGKPYVKVKVRFVDSLNFSTEQQLDNLETEVESLRKEVESLIKFNDNNERLIRKLQNLNINLYKSKKEVCGNMQRGIDNLVRKKENLHQSIRKLEMKIEARDSIIQKQNKRIDNLENELKSNEALMKKLDTLSAGVEPKKLRNQKGKPKFADLVNELEKLNKKLIIKEKRLKEKENNLEILISKSFEKEKKIECLQDKIANQKVEINRLIKAKVDYNKRIEMLQEMNKSLISGYQAKIAEIQKENDRLLWEKMTVENQLWNNGKEDDLEEKAEW